MYFFTDTAAGKKPRPASFADDPKDVGVKTRAELVAFVTKCVEDGAAEIKAKGDKGLMETVDDGGPHLDRLYDLAYGLTGHSHGHYGQLVVYYRINGLVPPESRPKKGLGIVLRIPAFVCAPNLDKVAKLLHAVRDAPLEETVRLEVGIVLLNKMSGVKKKASPLRAGASFVAADSGTIQPSRPSGTNSARKRSQSRGPAGPETTS